MKILHVINTLETGGAQSVLAALIKGWQDQNDEQIVFSLSGTDAVSRSRERLGFQAEFLNFKPGKFELEPFIRLTRMVRSYQPDVVQTWLYHADLIGSMAARLVSRNVPVIWGVHHTTSDSHSVKSSTWR